MTNSHGDFEIQTVMYKYFKRKIDHAPVIQVTNLESLDEDHSHNPSTAVVTDEPLVQAVVTDEPLLQDNQISMEIENTSSVQANATSIIGDKSPEPVGSCNEVNVPMPSEHNSINQANISRLLDDQPPIQASSALKRRRIEVDLSNLQSDPGLRIPISQYHPNDRDSVRRAYLLKGPSQPILEVFPSRIIRDDDKPAKKRKTKPPPKKKPSKKITPNSKKNNVPKPRQFCSTWYDEGLDWVEYSIDKDAVFCLHCYLFRPENQKKGGGQTFVGVGFRNWKKKEKLGIHIGLCGSAHNKAYRCGQDLLREKQAVQTFICRQSEQVRAEYRIRLTASVVCVRFLLRQGLPFRGHNESIDSINQGNFLELLKFVAYHNEVIRNVVLQNAPENHSMTCHDIQKEITNSAAVETTNAILNELGTSVFALLIDESRDISIKEQMAVVLRFVNENGCLVERFLCIVHVKTTSALSLKSAIDELFSKHGLCIGRLRGQGYDGASNMQGALNGLKALIMKENESAYSIHCFAHQLQLALVGAANNVENIPSFFNLVLKLLNNIVASCKRRDKLREAQADNVIKELQCGDLSSGKGQNQETTVIRPGDTRWGSHYRTVLSLIHMYPAVVDVLDDIAEDGVNCEQRCEASGLLTSIQKFSFIFILHLMRNVLGITDDLSKALQRKRQDIVNAMTLVKICKQRLQTMREDGWDSLLAAVYAFCIKNHIKVPKMEDEYFATDRSPRRRVNVITNLHHYYADLFIKCIDTQREELNNRFNEVNSELLLCVACLDPSDSFVSFDKAKLIRLAEFYPKDFTSLGLWRLGDQLENYVIDVRSNNEFLELHFLTDLAKKMVETKKNIVYPLVYLLITLSLVLPVATATVERAFSAMHIIKSNLRNRMTDEWMNDCLVTYIEKDIFNGIENEAIIQRFQKMKTRRGQLSDI